MPTPPRHARLRISPLRSAAAPIDVLAALAPNASNPVLLDSAATDTPFGRYSVLTAAPLEVIQFRDGRLTDAAGCVLATSPPQLFQQLDSLFASVQLTDSPPSRPAYLPGWFGYIGYEMGRCIERLPGHAIRDTAMPDLHLSFHDAIALHDAADSSWLLVELDFDDPPAGAGAAASLLRDAFSAASAAAASAPPATDPADAFAGVSRDFTPDAYRSAVARCIDYIAAGDIFQVNLSQRFTADGIDDPLRLYRILRQRNPAAYAAFLAFDAPSRRCAVLSSSPELFLRVRDGRVITRPIKGTRRRCGDAALDAAAAADLLASPKDNAELAMIVDLLRNDLGRVCRYGSVNVTDARCLETHPTVLHLVATVVGELAEEVGPAALIRASFPGGSITGAPKIRAMEIIDELEPTARGVYTGCIGTVGVDGAAEWNIAIRTIVVDGATAHIQAGGGIVADSDPAAEYEETLDKARALLQAIQAYRRG